MSVSTPTQSVEGALFDILPSPPTATLDFVQKLVDLKSFQKEDLGIICAAVKSVYDASNKMIIPRHDQLDCLLQLQRNDVIYIAATGSGKTLIIAMMLLLFPRICSVTVSPLKELQRGQVPHPRFLI